MDISTETTNHNETTVVDISNMLLSIARTGRMDRSWIEFRNIIEARIIEVFLILY